MYKFIIKNVFRKKFVAFLSALGIGFGLMLMFVLGSFSEGVTAQVESNISKVLGVVDITEAEQAGANSQLPVSTIDNILGSELGDNILNYNLEAELPTIYSRYYSINSLLGTSADSLLVKGLNKTIDNAWEGPTTQIIEGRDFNPGSYEVIIDSRLYDGTKTFGNSFGIGQNISLYLSYPDTSDNIIELEIVGIYNQEDSGAPSFVPREYYVYTDIETAWEIREIAWLEPYDYFNYYTKISLEFDSVNSEDTKGYIERLGEINNLGVVIEAFSLSQFQEEIGDNLSIINTFTLVISVITAIAGGMAIIVAQLNSVSQRIKEFAILKATGWKNSHIFKDIVFESLMIGTLGSGFGIGLGYLLIAFFSSGASPFGSITAVVSMNLILQIIIFGLVLGVIAGLYPGYKASKVRPVEVIKGK